MDSFFQVSKLPQIKNPEENGVKTNGKQKPNYRPKGETVKAKANADCDKEKRLQVANSGSDSNSGPNRAGMFTSSWKKVTEPKGTEGSAPDVLYRNTYGISGSTPHVVYGGRISLPVKGVNVHRKDHNDSKVSGQYEEDGSEPYDETDERKSPFREDSLNTNWTLHGRMRTSLGLFEKNLHLKVKHPEEQHLFMIASKSGRGNSDNSETFLTNMDRSHTDLDMQQNAPLHQSSPQLRFASPIAKHTMAFNTPRVSVPDAKQTQTQTQTQSHHSSVNTSTGGRPFPKLFQNNFWVQRNSRFMRDATFVGKDDDHNRRGQRCFRSGKQQMTTLGYKPERGAINLDLRSASLRPGISTGCG